MSSSANAGRNGWGWEKKAEVVSAYIALGSAPMVEAVTKVPAQTIRNWKTQDWWKELEGQLRDDVAGHTNSKLQKIVEKSLTLIEDRIDKGDFFFNNESRTWERRPVLLRDAARVSADIMDRQMLRERFKKVEQERVLLEDHIKKLAESFAAMTRQVQTKLPKEKFIEGEVIDAIHEERETGLQAGTGLGTREQTESGEGSSPA